MSGLEKKHQFLYISLFVILVLETTTCRNVRTCTCIFRMGTVEELFNKDPFDFRRQNIPMFFFFFGISYEL